MDIKDFIKVADAYGKVDQEDKQQVQEGLLDWFKDKLGLSDEEAQAATDAAAEAGANTETTPEVDPDANDPRTGNNDSGARGEPREPAEVPPGGAGVSGQAQAAAGSNAADPEAEPEAEPTAAPDTDNAQIPGEPDTFQRDTGAGGADPAGTGSVDDPANQNLDQRGTREPEDTRDLMTRYNSGGKKAMPEVEQLQRDLEELGFDPNGIDGKYGRGTYAAVQAFQKANGLQVDGQAGPNTLAKIQELKGGEAPAAEPAAQQTGSTGATASGDQGDGTRGTGTAQDDADSADDTAEPAAQTAGPDDGNRGGQTTPDYSNMSDEEAQNTISTASPDLISQLSPAERRALRQLQQANDRGVDQLPRDF